MNTNTKIVKFFENVVVVAIILVLIQTFLEDFAVVAGWRWNFRKVLIISGFCFDLFFTIEFLSRLFYSVLDGKAGDYILRRRGWIDFLASIPLLLLNSGPAVIAIALGTAATIGVGGILNVLKVVKAVRIARILRLLRVLKIFKQIKYADSKMAQRHVATITSITITCFVLIIFFFHVLASVTGIPTVDGLFEQEHRQSSNIIIEQIEQEGRSSAFSLAENFPDLLLIKEKGATVYSRYEKEFYNSYFGPGDYRYIEQGELGFFYDLRTAHKHQSKDNILFFIIIVVLVLVFLFYYSPHFAITVTDPIHVMKKGLEDNSYNLEVKIPDLYQEDDVFELAYAYNEVYLPMKDRNAIEEGAGGMVDLKMDDLQDFFQEEE